MEKKLRLNVLFNIIASLFTFGFGFISTPYLVKTFDVQLYGIYALCMVFAGYFGFLDFGIDQATTKFIAEHKSDNSVVNKVITNSVIFSSITGIFVSSIFFVLGEYNNIIFEIDEGKFDLAKEMFFILAGYTLLFWPLKLSLNFLFGYEKYHFASINNLFLTLGYIIVLIITIVEGKGIQFYFAGVCISRLITYSLLWVYIFVKYRIKFSYSYTMIKKMLSFSIYIFSTKILGILTFQTDSILISTFLPIQRLSYYEFASKIHSIPKMGNSILTNPLIPNASVNSNDSERLSSNFISTARINVGILTGGIITLVFLAKPLYEVWLSKELSSFAYLAQIFISYWLINCHTGPISAVLQGVNKQRLVFKYSLFAATFNLILSVILINFFEEMGVILGTVISSILGTPIFLKMAFQEMKFPFLNYWKKVFIPQIRSIVFVAVLILIFHSYLDYISTIWHLMLAGFLIMGVQSIIFFFKIKWLKF